jgi:hypothetical protein
MQVSGNGYEQLNEAIQASSFQYRQMTSKAEIVDYYKATYPGKGSGGWRDMLARDLSAMTGTKYNTIRRQFDPSRINNAPVKGSKNEQGFRTVGKQLPPVKEPKNTSGKKAKVSFDGMVCIPSGKKGKSGKVQEDCRERHFSATLNASQASKMKQGNFGPIFDAYGLDPGVIGSIDAYSVSVDFS